MARAEGGAGPRFKPQRPRSWLIRPGSQLTRSCCCARPLLHRVACVGEWSFLLHAPASAATLRDTLGRSPSVLGVAARLSEEHGRWTVARVVLAGPTKPDRCYLAVFRRDGTLDVHGGGALA